ncbi:MAG: hypothetical protein OET90_03430 [Desulfuromonadales bacterium]|nr:hypothetical protein [Desulfuromonadales bacterium]
MMIPCRHCGAAFDPQNIPDDHLIQAGLILAQERYGDAGKVCPECLASRAKLSMMYDPSCHN